MERSGADAAERATVSQQAAQTHQNQTRLAQAHATENFQGFVAGILAEGTARRSAQGIDEAAVVVLLKMMDGAANEEMQIEFTAQAAKFAARAASQNRFGHADSAAQPCDNTADGADFNLRCRITDEKNLAAAQSFADRDPTRVNRNARALKRERLKFPFH